MSLFFTTERSNPGFGWSGLTYFTVKSPALGRRADVTVYMAENLPTPCPIVILLHGVYSSHWAWALNGGVHETMHRLIAAGLVRPMLLVMPSDGLWGDGSSYSPHQNEDYAAWITQDVIQLMYEQIPQCTVFSPLFITGLSMGGYGALMLGAKYSHLFSAFSGLSSITRFKDMALFVQDFDALSRQVSPQEDVLRCILDHRSEHKPLRFDCGLDDPLLEANRALHEQLIIAGIPHQYAEHPGGHTWTYWQEHIADHLIFFEECLKSRDKP